MKRREFSVALGAGSLLLGCSGESGKPPADTGAAGSSTTVPPAPTPAEPSPEPSAQTSSSLSQRRTAVGTNLSGMEWAAPGLRYGLSSGPNLHFTVPRAADVAYLAAQGFTKNRLPIQWELLQPMLHDTVANDAARAAIGQPGAFHPYYEGYITGILDAHAAAGITCIIDLHNYARYQDFRYQADGSVPGLTQPPNPLYRPYTTDPSQVQQRIFALAPGATLQPSHFADFWGRAAARWKDHPGLGGYGLMNEPHDLPRAGTVTASNGGEDLNILPAFVQAAIQAIRAVDADTPIYVPGNEWSAAMTIGRLNPAYPLAGKNLIYEVHMYLDAFSNGHAFDWDTEVAKNYSAGFGSTPITTATGHDRLKIALDWAKAKGVTLALTEVGMPIDDVRWQTSFSRAAIAAQQAGCEVFSWMGGNHWQIRNYPINQTPGWHQNKTLEPAVAGVLKAAAGIAGATLYDDGPGYALAGTPLTFTVYARGNLSAPLSVAVSASNGGSLSKTQLTIPAGANGQDSFSYSPGLNRVSTLSYASADAQIAPPPPRRVFSLNDPVAYEATSLADAALAILAKYSACQWNMADAYTDYLQGQPATAGQLVRAVADSGFGSSPGNAMEMLNWVNKEPFMGSMQVPVMHLINGRPCTDHTAYDTHGLWCKKTMPRAGVVPNPRNRAPYNLEDPHFALAAISVPGSNHTGVVFQASRAESLYRSELRLSDNKPELSFADANGQSLRLTALTGLAPGMPSVLALTCQPGAQRLRLNTIEVAAGSATFAPSTFAQLLIGWGFLSFYPRDGFQGHVFAIVTGKGVPRTDELLILERYLASLAGTQL